MLGDNEDSALRDIEASLNLQIPIIVLEGSSLCQEITDLAGGEEKAEPGEKDKPTNGAEKAKVLQRLAKFGKMVPCKDDSETIASLIHLCLTIAI